MQADKYKKIKTTSMLGPRLDQLNQASCTTFLEQGPRSLPGTAGMKRHCSGRLWFSRQVVSDSVTPWTVAHQASLSITNSRSLPRLMSIESVMPSNHLILCRPLLLLPSVFPSVRVFSNESALRIRWPKDWSFSISPSNDYSGLISFRIDWFDLLAVQGTLKSLF